jgi:hypothetical protein
MSKTPNELLTNLIGDLAASVIRTQRVLDEGFARDVRSTFRLDVDADADRPSRAVAQAITAAMSPTPLRVSRSSIRCDIEIDRRRSLEFGIGCRVLQIGWSMRTAQQDSTRSSIQFEVVATPLPPVATR